MGKDFFGFSPRLSKSNGLVNEIFTRPFSLVVQTVVQNIITDNFCLLQIIMGAITSLLPFLCPANLPEKFSYQKSDSYTIS